MAMRPAVLILAWFALFPGAADADWKETHKLGVEAVEAGQWADAERFFRAALEERSEERISRLTKATYLPHYYLGVALAEQGDCKRALASWEESERQGVSTKSKQGGDLARRKEQCQGYLRQVNVAVSEVEDLLSDVAAASESLLTLSRTPELAPLWTQGGASSFSSRQLDAAQQLENARQRHREGTTQADLEMLATARDQAQKALAAFEATVATSRQRLGELNAETASALETLEQAQESARRVMRSIYDLKPYPQRLAARVATVESLLTTIDESKSGAGANQLQTLTDELTVALASVRRSARRPPEKLTRAAEAFFGGRFAEVLEISAEEDFARDARSRSHLCLLRSASQHALWILGGERDEALLELSASELAPCHEIDPALPPPPKYFSPRFVAFYETSLEAMAAEEVEEGAATTGADDAASLEESR